MKAKHYIGMAMMILPIVFWAIGGIGIAAISAIAVPIGWQLFFSNGDTKKLKHRAF